MWRRPTRLVVVVTCLAGTAGCGEAPRSVHRADVWPHLEEVVGSATWRSPRSASLGTFMRARSEVRAALRDAPGLVARCVAAAEARGDDAATAIEVLTLAEDAALPAMLQRLEQHPADPVAVEVLSGMVETQWLLSTVESRVRPEWQHELAARARRLERLLAGCERIVAAAPPASDALLASAWTWLRDALPRTWPPAIADVAVEFVVTSPHGHVVAPVAQALLDGIDPREPTLEGRLERLAVEGGAGVGGWTERWIRAGARFRLDGAPTPPPAVAVWEAPEPRYRPGEGPWCPGPSGPMPRAFDPSEWISSNGQGFRVRRRR